MTEITHDQTRRAREYGHGFVAGLDDVIGETEGLMYDALQENQTLTITTAFLRRLRRRLAYAGEQQNLYSLGVGQAYTVALSYLRRHKGRTLTLGFTRTMRLTLHGQVEIPVHWVADIPQHGDSAGPVIAA